MARKASAKGESSTESSDESGQAKYPRHAVERALRIPKAILDQNAGKACTDKEAATFVGVGFAGPFRVEISSALKYGLLHRPGTGRIEPTDLARKILRPQNADDRIDGLREAIRTAPQISDVYEHYRGEKLPDSQFFRNALSDKFRVPVEKAEEFETIFHDSMRSAEILVEYDGEAKLLDVTKLTPAESDRRLKKLGKDVEIAPGDKCFVMMPFAPPIGSYYGNVFEPAIRKAGLTAVRADNEIFGTGKIMDQVWRGISESKVLVAELTHRNPNVFYELGLAHALQKPVVLVSSNEGDVPFDLRHIRVIYYDMSDPFWGNKLIEKIAENLMSAIATPEEAVFQHAVGGKYP